MTANSHPSNSSGDFVAGIQQAVQQNPVSAALIGMGLAWMFAGGNRLSAGAALLPALAKGAVAGATDGVLRSAGVAGAAVEGAKSIGERVVEGVSDSLKGVSGTVANAAAGTMSGVKSAAQSSSDVPVGALQQNLRETFERQPLLLGAIGLAIGASMAAAFASTSFEKEAVGDVAERVKDRIVETASEQVDRARSAAERTLEAVKEEVQTQGLTLEAAKQGAADIGQKVKNVAASARSKS